MLRRNCLLKHVSEGMIEGRIEVVGKQGRTSRQLLDDLKETRGRTVRRIRSGRGSGPVVRQIESKVN